MTQQETAVGGATNDEPVIAAEPTLEDRFAAFSEEPQADDPADEQPQGDAPAEDEPILEADDLEETDLPPIDVPVSWPDEDKAAFAELPRALQERISAREGEREKFVQAKSREAATSAQRARDEAAQRIQDLHDGQIRQLVSLLPEIPPEPSAQLLVNDPQQYAAEMDYVKQVAAYRRELEGQIVGIAENQKQHEAQAAHDKRQADIAMLQQELPEYFDPQNAGFSEAKLAEFQQTVKSTALAAGYSEDQLAHADGADLLALHKAAGWKTKADKYDALMAKQMAKVREAKDLPRVSRPGSATTKGAVANQRYTADREAMRNGDRDAAQRVFGRFVNQ